MDSLCDPSIWAGGFFFSSQRFNQFKLFVSAQVSVQFTPTLTAFEKYCKQTNVKQLHMHGVAA